MFSAGQDVLVLAAGQQEPSMRCRKAFAAGFRTSVLCGHMLQQTGRKLLNFGPGAGIELQRCSFSHASWVCTRNMAKHSHHSPCTACLELFCSMCCNLALPVPAEDPQTGSTDLSRSRTSCTRLRAARPARLSLQQCLSTHVDLHQAV